MNQWYDELVLSFGVEVGLLGGGYYDIRPLTVTTYDSAYLNMDRLGNKFGFIVFDECHHLPSPTYGLAATCAIAPFRLGLTATPERADNAHMHLDQLIGPIVYRREITQLRGQYLADYRVMTLYVHLSDEDRSRYEQARELYRGFVREAGIDMRRPNGWSQFIYVAHQSAEGREAFRAYREQRNAGAGRTGQAQPPGPTARAAQRRPRADLHPRQRDRLHDRPAIPRPRHHASDQDQGAPRDPPAVQLRRFPIVATSRVLNEGVNVPEANVAIILSGSGSVREHVQRAGANPPQVGGQGGRPLRGHHPRYRRGIHLQPPSAARRLRREFPRDSAASFASRPSRNVMTIVVSHPDAVKPCTDPATRMSDPGTIHAHR